MKAKYQQKMLRKLERSGVLKPMVMPEPAWEKPRPRIAIIIPSYKAPHPLMVESIGEVVRFTQPVADCFFVPRQSSCVVQWVRNSMLADLIVRNEPFDYVLYVDDDMVPEPDSLVKLLSHRQHIVAALCTRRVDPPIPNMMWLEKNLEFAPILQWKAPTPLLQVDAAGTGMMLISREAVDAVGEFYLRCGYERQVFGRMANAAMESAVQLHGNDGQEARVVADYFDDELEKQFAFMEADRRETFRRTGNASWFQFLQKLNQRGEYGEDLSFCLKARFCGIEVFTDTSVNPGHVGDYVYSIHDFYAYRQGMIEQKRQAEPEIVVTE